MTAIQLVLDMESLLSELCLQIRDTLLQPSVPATKPGCGIFECSLRSLVGLDVVLRLRQLLAGAIAVYNGLIVFDHEAIEFALLGGHTLRQL
ncbi:hypothetical protein PRIC1_012153 [Phytophthora ramorum]